MRFAMRTEERLISTDRNVVAVPMIMRRPSDRRWSLTIIKAISGTTRNSVSGSNNRKLVAFARMASDVQTERAIYVPLLDADIEPQQAKVQNIDIDTHGPSEKCPGCRDGFMQGTL